MKILSIVKRILHSIKIEFFHRLYFLVYPLCPKVNLVYPCDYDGVGGPTTFMKLFDRSLTGKHSRNSIWCRPKKLFFPIQYDISLIQFWKKKGVQIYQRLDGVYYPSHFSEAEVSLNEPIKEIYQSLTDVIIFQSKYSKAQCKEVLGDSTASAHIIYNGVNKDIFYPNPERVRGDFFELVMSGNFREIDMVEPLVQMMKLLDASDLSFVLNIIGPVAEKYQEMFKIKNVRLLGVMGAEQIVDYLRKSDIFVYSFLNPNCPNSVVEAIGVGLPVVGFDSGSMAELCSFQKELLIPVSDKVIQEYHELSSDKLAERVMDCALAYERYRSAALDNAYRFDIRDTMMEYRKVIGI